MKNSELKKLDQILKDKLSEGTAQVPDFVWDRIEEELFPDKKRRVFFWWFFGGFCLLVISVFIAVAVSGLRVHSQNNMTPNSRHISNSFQDQKSLLNDTPSNHTVPNRDSAKKQVLFRPNVAKNQPVSPFRIEQSTHKNTKIKSRTGMGTRTKSTFTSGSKRRENSSQKSDRANMHTTKGVLEYSEKTEEGLTDKTHSNATSQEAMIPGKAASEMSNEGEKRKANSTYEVPQEKELNYAQILELIQRDFPEKPHEQKEKPQYSGVSIGIFGGPSLYHTAVFKDYFTSGQLSKRTFASSGFELGLQARVKLGNRFNIYAGLAFNQKKTQFNYNVSITEADYFTYVENGEKVPLENIHDDGKNSCFLAAGVTAKYQIQTTSISIGTSFEFLRIGKFSAAADLRLSGNLYSSLKLQEMLVLDIAQPSSETFSQLQPGAGLIFNYRLNDRISLGLSPFLSKQFYLKKSFLHRMDELVIPVTCSFRL